MCQLGRSGKKVHEIPKEGALKAYKSTYKGGDGYVYPLAFSAPFERLNKNGTVHSVSPRYHRGGTFRTEPPLPPDGENFESHVGNGRGFWAWKTNPGNNGSLYRHVYEVRMWGKVVKHRLGYRAEYVKFVKRVK